MARATALFVDEYVSFSQHIFTDAKDPVLMLDYSIIHHTEIKEVLARLNIQDIYSVAINTFPVPVKFYGQNARNGLVQILTKRKARR